MSTFFNGAVSGALSALKDPRASGSRTSSAWGDLALNLVSAAGAVGVTALEKKTGIISTQDAANAARNIANVAQRTSGQITTPGQPTQKAALTNKPAIIIGAFVLLVGSAAVWLAFRHEG